MTTCSSANLICYLEEEPRSKEDVHDREHEEHGQSRHQGSAQVQELSVWAEEWCQWETNEDNTCSEEGSGDDAWFYPDGHVKQWSQGHSTEEGKAAQETHTLHEILPSVWGKV